MVNVCDDQRAGRTDVDDRVMCVAVVVHIPSVGAAMEAVTHLARLSFAVRSCIDDTLYAHTKL